MPDQFIPQPYKHVGLLLLLSLLAGLSFYQSVSVPFFSDDQHSVHANPSIRSFWPLWNAFAAPHENPLAGRPLVNFSFAMNYAVSGLSPWSYHVVNVVIHIANACLLYLVLWRLAEKLLQPEPYRSLFAILAASLWLVHPIQAEVICYVTQRTEVMVTTFLLLAIYVALRSDQFASWWTVLAIAAGAGAAFCKESAVVLPALVCVLDVSFAKESLFVVIRKRWTFYAGLASLWVITAALMLSGPRSDSVGFGKGFTVFEYLQTQCWALFRYLSQVLWPNSLLIDYGTIPVTNPEQVLPGAILVGLSILSIPVLWFISRPLCSIPLLVLILLSPTSSFVPIVTEVGAERRVYLAVSTFCAVLAWCIVRSVQFWSDSKIKPVAIVLGFLTGVFVVGVYVSVSQYRVAEFVDQERLWARASNTHSQNYRAPLVVATKLFNRGEYAQAMQWARVALGRPGCLLSAYDVVCYSLIYLEQPQAAIRECELAIPRFGSSTGFWVLYGKISLETGDRAKASDCLRRAIAIDGQNAVAHNILATVIWKENPGECVTLLETAVRLKPDYIEAYLNLAGAYLKTGRVKQAVESYRLVLQLDPGNQSAKAVLSQIIR